MIPTLGISRIVDQLHMEIKKTWHGRRYFIVQHTIQQERKGVKWAEVAREKNTVSLAYPFTPDGHTRCKKDLIQLRKQMEAARNEEI